MSLFNTTLIGRIGNDPVTRQAGNSTVTEIQIAYENRRANNPVTAWVKVECWNGLGTDVVAKFARKGDRIAITANRFRTEAYTTQDGQPASTPAHTSESHCAPAPSLPEPPPHTHGPTVTSMVFKRAVLEA